MNKKSHNPVSWPSKPKLLLSILQEQIGKNDRVIMFSKPWDADKFNKVQDQDEGNKPWGLWYSFGMEWIKWVIGEQPNWLGKYIYKLNIDTSNIIRLNTVDSVLKFGESFGIHNNILDIVAVDWLAVAENYKGIEIHPYQWSLRLDDRVRWYYGWDVASGCIWDPSVIRGVKEIDV